ncbi:MAG: histidine phosphatase family protein [Parachlamydiaceae bacterium]
MSAEAPIHLILARHGNTFESGQKPVQVGSQTDMPLTAEGKQQAHRLGRYLADRGVVPQAIYAGPLKRQIETATIVAEELHAKERIHTHEPALVEVDYGFWEGLADEEVMAKWPSEYKGWTQQAVWGTGIFGGSLQQHLMSIEKWLEELRKKYAPGDTVLGITSNGIIRFFHSLQRDAWERLVKEGRMQAIKVKTGHFCEIQLFKHSIKVISWNVAP